jgi:hypothetical protein
MTQFSGLVLPVFVAVIQLSEVLSSVLAFGQMPSALQAKSLPAPEPGAIAPPLLHANVTAPDRFATYTYPTFNSKQFDRQLKLYLEYQAAFGTPDVLIVGSSRALQGVDPLALQQALVQRNHAKLRVFNFGINGATAQVVDLLIRRILTPDQLPRLILWADGSRAFNSGRLDITYNGIVASQGYRQLSAGVRPSLPAAERQQVCVEALPGHFADRPPSQAQAGVPNETQNMPQPREKTITPPSPTDESGIPELLCGTPKQFLQQLSPLHLPPAKQSPPVNLLEVNKAGLQSVSLRFDPVTYYQRYPWVPGQYDGDYQNFRLQGNQTAALERLIQFTQSRKIPLVFVNLPLTERYLDWARQDYENAFWRYMAQFSRRGQIIFRDISRHPQLSRNENFADPSHLNRFGAAAIGKHLAQDPSIPWHRIPGKQQ